MPVEGNYTIKEGGTKGKGLSVGPDQLKNLGFLTAHTKNYFTFFGTNNCFVAGENVNQRLSFLQIFFDSHRDMKVGIIM